MIDRITQVITSPFGWRKGFKLFHKGVDLRSWDDDFKKRLPAVLPEPCVFIRQRYQKKWGWTYVFYTVNKETLKFTHVNSKIDFEPGVLYSKNMIVGFSELTDYMKEKGYGEHLHFEYWPKNKPVNPVKYLDKNNIDWRLA